MYSLFKKHPRISTDTRRIVPDSLFFALRGASFDGNRFAAEALARGAAYAVVDDPEAAASNPRMVLVADVLTALQDLARTHRRALGIPILAIAGSNGKTTTKELLRCVLAQRYAVHATQGNLNNHIGVPLTLLAMDGSTQFGIVEMGASACGEIAALAAIAEPDFGILTNIGRAHLEGFGGPEGIRRGKGELYDFLAAHGRTAFVRQDDPTLAAMAAERPAMPVIGYTAAEADGFACQLEGAYNRLNVAAAVAVGRHFGVSEVQIRQAVAGYTPDNNRSQRIQTEHNTLFIDCYNANPSSMQAALTHFAAQPAAGSRRVFILGDMLELGAWSAAEHAAALRCALQAADAEVLLVGPRFAEAAAAEAAAESAAGRVRCYADCTALAAALHDEPLRGAEVLLKGSRGIGLERLVEYL